MNEELEKVLQDVKILTAEEKELIRKKFPTLDRDSQEKALAMLRDEEAILMAAAKQLTE